MGFWVLDRMHKKESCWLNRYLFGVCLQVMPLLGLVKKG